MERRREKQPNTVWIQRIASGAILLVAGCLFGALAYAAILYGGLRPILPLELGREAPEASAFVVRGEATYLLAPGTHPAKGLHTLRIRADGRERAVWLWVRDTLPPQASGTERTVSTLATLSPDALIESLSDADDRIRVSFAAEPPFGTVGDWETKILLEDTSGNRSSVTALLHIRKVVEGLTVEAGDEAPAAEAFLTDAYRVDSLTPIDGQMLCTPGAHPIELVIDGERHETVLHVTDTVAPVVETRTVLLKPGSAARPEDFLKTVADKTAVTAAFLNEPDPDERNFQSVAIRVVDAGGNATDVEAGLLFTHAEPLTVEARKTPLTAEECSGRADGAALIKTFVPDTAGIYAVSLQVNGEPEIALVEVVDTVPPTLQTGTFVWYVDHPTEPDRFCRVEDVSPVELSFADAVDWTQPGEQRVRVRAVDASGNETTGELTLRLKYDDEPPVLYGIKPRYFYVDDAVSYLSDVAAIDAADGAVEVAVDNSAVDPSRAGQYYVTYSATDRSGNTVTARAIFTFRRSTVTRERLEKYTTRILERITTEEMSLADKVLAIYDYCYKNVRYSARSDKGDWRKEALLAIQKGRGDCFTSNALARALLELTDAEVYSVQRASYNTNHYWLLVNVGTGWYHFDATNSREHYYKCRMWTDQQCSIMGGFWGYEKSIAPTVAVERFDRDKAAAVEADWVEQHRQKAGNDE